DRGGFDLQIGNPPCVLPDWNEADILGDFDVAFELENKMPIKRWDRLKDDALSDDRNFTSYIEQASYNAGNRAYLSDVSTYPIIAGLRTDLYRCFMEQTWRTQSSLGAVGLIHPETHFAEESAYKLRQSAYGRIRRHWHFINKMMLFDISDHVIYGIHVYSRIMEHPGFLMASW